MAPEIPSITERNQTAVEHIAADVHEILGLLAKVDGLVQEFRPLLDQWRAPLASMLTRRGNGRRRNSE